MDKETLKRMAKAAHIALGEDELERYCGDLNEVLDFLAMLDNTPGEDGYVVGPIEVIDVFREDIPGIFIDPYELLKNMKTYENYVRGPRLL